MSKIYCYNEPIFQGGALIGNDIVEITEEGIIDLYWKFWSGKMVKKYGEGHELITKENCIDDFLMVNWAWEKSNE